ncbi:MAG: DEAD/DEAH box helicase family protein [Elusimicrobiota bacterium]
MVDFKARLKAQQIDTKVDPKELYDSLDRAVDKGPLRPAQEFILQDWFANHKDDRDIIIKLHTGQGKTLVGLLMLLSRLNQGKGSSLYLCPNNYLVSQTCTQASQFGIPYCEITNDIPPEFYDGKKLLITSVQRLFNGLSKFGIGSRSIPIGAILVDDAHTCIESIRNACTIKFEKKDTAYSELITLFSTDLENQGAGTFADIKSGSFDAIQCVPYWSWQDKQPEVVEILVKNNDSNNVKFAWPLLKDNLQNCFCMFSGQSVEISSSIIPLYLFGSFSKANQRIFMSATFFDDSFLVKGFGISEQTIRNPLLYPNEKWAGEKMVLIPSLIDEKLDRSEIVKFIAERPSKNFGVVILTNSFARTKDWKAYGCIIANKDDIENHLDLLRNGKFTKPIVIVNRYDGIDLPDQMCRFLVLDSKPFLGSLFDRYMQYCRTNSLIIENKIAQTIEQGMGRAVRGEKDYCSVILIGPELIKAIHSSKSRRFFSVQTRTQIEIGLEVSEMAKEDVSADSSQLQVFYNLLTQLLKRDPGWKEFYTEKMNAMTVTKNTGQSSLDILLLEKQSDDSLLSTQSEKAIEHLQKIIDLDIMTDDEKGWYLQEIARILYPTSKTKSNTLQVAAHKNNRFLLKPLEGMHITKLEKLSQKRGESIINWIKGCGNFSDLQLAIQEILSCISFGTHASRFEKAMDQLGKALGFETQQPDKEWKGGPDNLWLVEDNKYLLFECKSEVDLKRAEINKTETGQMNNSIAWFEREYGQSNAVFFQIIPTKIISKAAGYSGDVQIVRENSIRKLRNNVRSFFREFEKQNFDNLSVDFINNLLTIHHLWSEPLKLDTKS